MRSDRRAAPVRRVSLGRFLRSSPTAFLFLCVLPIAVPLLVGADLLQVVTARFEGRRYSIPSRLYSDRLVLSTGLRFPPDTLVAKLIRLGYREAEDLTPPGTYHSSKEARGRLRLDVHFRDFDYPLRSSRGRLVTIRYVGDAVSDLRDSAGQALARLAVEPEVIGTVYDRQMEDRTVVRLDQVSPRLVRAILAIEDRDFEHHGGVNPKGLLRAVLENLRGHRQGGSTLTQQLVKNILVTPERTLRRKLVEAFLALILDARYTKDQILEAYLNEIYLGQRGPISVTGVQAAARYYFGHDAANLGLSEAALLAGMIQSPGNYEPWRHPDRAKTRRATVLAVMAQEGIATSGEVKAAGERPLTTLSGPRRPFSAAYFADYVLKEVEDALGSPGERGRLGREGMRVFTTLDADVQIRAEAAVAGGLVELEKSFPSLRPSRAGGRLEAALVALTPANGYIRAMVGGRDHATSEFNRVTQARRQPGSLFKPFIYLSGFEKEEGKPLLTTDPVRDSPITVVWDRGKVEWSPHDYDGKFRGTVSVREALEESLNIPAVRIALGVGLDRIIDIARACGIESRLEPYPSLALGAFELSPLEIAFAYTTFANGGIRPSEPVALLAVVDGDGHLVARPERPLERAASPEGVYILDSVLQGVLDHGTGVKARRLGVRGPMAGKTGTTNDFHDAWFVGFSPKILAAVWVGFDGSRDVGHPGSRAALPIWAEWVRALPPSWTDVGFERPPGIVEREIDPETGQLATPRCPEVRTEPFRIGTEPTELCYLHRLADRGWSYGPTP